MKKKNRPWSEKEMKDVIYKREKFPYDEYLRDEEEARKILENHFSKICKNFENHLTCNIYNIDDGFDIALCLNEKYHYRRHIGDFSIEFFKAAEKEYFVTLVLDIFDHLIKEILEE